MMGSLVKGTNKASEFMGAITVMKTIVGKINKFTHNF